MIQRATASAMWTRISLNSPKMSVLTVSCHMQRIRTGFRVRLGALAPQTQGNCSKELEKQNASYYGPADAHCGKKWNIDISINF